MGVKYSSVGKLHSVSSCADDCWRDYQSVILPEIHRWMDAGWEPISEVGSAAFRTREEPLGCLMAIFESARYESQRDIFIDEFRVKMRKRQPIE